MATGAASGDSTALSQAGSIGSAAGNSTVCVADDYYVTVYFKFDVGEEVFDACGKRWLVVMRTTQRGINVYQVCDNVTCGWLSEDCVFNSDRAVLAKKLAKINARLARIEANQGASC